MIREVLKAILARCRRGAVWLGKGLDHPLWPSILVSGAVVLVLHKALTHPLDANRSCGDTGSDGWVGYLAVTTFTVGIFVMFRRSLSGRMRAGEIIVSLLVCYWAVITGPLVSYMEAGILNSDNLVASDRWDYLYFSIVTITTLGYGDFRPCPAVRLTAAWQALIGFASYPFATAILVSLMRQPSTPKSSTDDAPGGSC